MKILIKIQSNIINKIKISQELLKKEINKFN